VLKTEKKEWTTSLGGSRRIKLVPGPFLHGKPSQLTIKVRRMELCLDDSSFRGEGKNKLEKTGPKVRFEVGLGGRHPKSTLKKV